MTEVGPIIGVTSVTTEQQLGKTGLLQQPGPWTQRLTRGELLREAKRIQSAKEGKFGGPGKSGTHSSADGRSKGERAPNGASGYAPNGPRFLLFEKLSGVRKSSSFFRD